MKLRKGERDAIINVARCGFSNSEATAHRLHDVMRRATASGMRIRRCWVYWCVAWQL